MIAPLKLTDSELITRRRMLGGTTAAAALLLAGCSSAANSSNSGGGGSKGSAGGPLSIGSATDFAPSTLLRAGPNGGTFSLIFDTLAVLEPGTSRRVPSVATGWRWNADRTQLTVDLRSDVRYHTGRLLEPRDVLFSVKATEDPTTGSQIGGTALHIKSMVQSGPHQVRFTLHRPIPSFLDVLVMTGLVDRETYGDLATGKKVVGTGPFVFENWTPGTSVTLRRNPHYWRPGLPYVSGVKERIFGSEQSLIAALRSGEIDLAYSLTPRDAALLDKSGYPTVSSAPWFSEYYVGANVKAPPFDDVRVRQAVAYGLNRERIVKQAFAGFGTVSCLPWPTSTPGVDPSQQNYYTYDLAKARALFKEAGSPSQTIPLQVAANPVSEAVLNVVQYDLAAVGFKLNAQAVQTTEFQALQIGAKFQGLFSAPVAQFDLDIATVLLGNAPFKIGANTANVTAPEYARLGEALIYAAGPAAQRRATAAFTQYVLEQAWHLTFGHVPLTSARNAKLSGVSATAGMAIDLTQAKA